MGSMAAQLIVGAVGPLIVFVDNKANADRFLMAAILFGILSLACYMACVKLSTERIVMDETRVEKANFGKTVKGLIKNKPLIWILIASLLFMINMMLIGTVNVYLFKDYFGNAKILSIVGIVQSVAAFIAIPFANPLVRKYGKKEIASVGMALAAIVYILLFFLPNISSTVFVAITAVGMFGFAFFNIVVWAFVTDVIDYHEFLTGLREDGTVYSIYSFARKVGQAIAGGLGGVVIGAIGYNASKTVQPQSVLNGIHTLATLIPAAVYIVIFLILVFLYPLTKKRTLQLAVDLTERRTAAKGSKEQK
jgi:GPH family glycoside/pentoside/hexuronide:cation symporter